MTCKNKIIKDVAGNSSVMVYIPKFNLSDVIDGAPNEPHPAFIVNGRILEGIYISKFQNTLSDGLAISVPDVDPTVYISFDGAKLACERKGDGWHLMTAAEWGAVALLCLKNGFLPYGNNDNGKDIREADVTARITCLDEENGVCRVATGSGPLTWNHNGREDGISDLNGNVWEWNAGVRLAFGELQLSFDGEDWRAIDASTGEPIAPRGDGKTIGSIKLDYIDGKFVYISGNITSSLSKPRYCDFADVIADVGISEKSKILLKALGLFPLGNAKLYGGVSLYSNNGAAERMIFRGGRWGQGLNAGVFKTCIDDARDYSGKAVGFRSAYYDFD